MKNISFSEETTIIRKSGLFDRSYYLKTYGDISEAGVDALWHYCTSGWREGRNPATFFSTEFYLKTNPDVAEANVNPFLHFLLHGKSEARQTRADMVLPAEPIREVVAVDWKQCTSRISKNATIDIIVPVYRGYKDTKACLYSVLTAKSNVTFNLIVVNDCSPEPRLTQFLRALAKRNLFQYIENESNYGFTTSVNNGMRLNAERDKLLLNSDTVVYDTWLDRILAHSAEDLTIGTITPLSNNATICSYPIANVGNNYSVETSYALLDLIASLVNKGVRFEVPTGVGFCMYIRAKCIEEVGYFDVETFNRGYGEENDFCRRVAAVGWKNIAIGDVFVRHTGEVSFALDAATQQQSGYRALVAKHPTYETEVMRFVNRDPLRIARMAIDIARIFTHLQHNKDNVIFVAHSLGGGIETHIRDLHSRLESEHTGILTLRPSNKESGKYQLNVFGEGLFLPNLDKIDDYDLINYVIPVICRIKKLSTVHVHSLVNFDVLEMKGILDEFARKSIKIIATLHDYSPVCPRIFFVDDGNDFCFFPAEDKCRACLRNFDATPKIKTITNYISEYQEVIALFSLMFVPSRAAADIYSKLYPERTFLVREHLERPVPGNKRRRIVPARRLDNRATGKTPLHVVSIGAIGPHKGSRILLRCATDAISRNLPIKFSIIGYSDIDNELLAAGVSITGKFSSEKEAIRLLAKLRADIAFMPSVWPETYMYTISTALKAGIFPVAFDIGAQAERIRNCDFGALIDFNERFNPKFINDALIEAAKDLGVPPRDPFCDQDNRKSTREYYGYEAS